MLVALFAVGVFTGTILSFELGLLWPAFTGTFGFAVEGFSFFTEAIFIGIYVYGWELLAPRTHLLTGLRIVLTGGTGSLTVISVNGWMNHPTGFALRDGRVVDVAPVRALFGNPTSGTSWCTCTSPATWWLVSWWPVPTRWAAAAAAGGATSAPRSPCR